MRGHAARSAWRRISAPRLFAGSFLLLVGLGTVGFRVLPGLYTGAPLGWLDALFTATSAVCVTGLIVVDTATYFTRWGQAYVLLLIQLGGLGMVTFGSLIILALGRRLSLRQEALSGSADVAPHIEIGQLTRAVVRFTFGIEALGAGVLYLLWAPRLGWREAAWPAVFHAVSAFCNAGFSTFTASLIPFQRSPFTLMVIGALVITGGLGFLTLEELNLRRAAARRGERFRVSLHSRLVLVTTGVLLLCGWIAFTVTEWRFTLGGLPYWARPIVGLFMSVTARTAGFNPIDYAQASDGTNFLTILLMAVGGSPGSTAGGLKTTTFAVLGLLAWSRVRGRGVVSAGGRSIPPETVQRAVGLFAVAFGAMTTAILLLAVLQTGRPAGTFLGYMFEVVSAFSTVGLSMGVTPHLGSPARLLVALLMFVGRVGPLTFAAAIALRAPSGAAEMRYAYQDVAIG